MTKLHKEAAIETAKLQNESVKLQFEIKAAEIAFSGKTPEAVTNRAKVLKTIFGDRLPRNFPLHLIRQLTGVGKETPEEKMFFLELLLKHQGREAEIIKGWEALFGDTWLARVKPIILEEANSSQSEPHRKEKGALNSSLTSANPVPQDSTTRESDSDQEEGLPNQSPSSAPKTVESPRTPPL